jgi:hypothetical protein
MKLKLLHEWLGNQPGAVVDVRDSYAPSLIERGTAEMVKEEESFKKMQRKDKDKMVSNSVNK